MSAVGARSELAIIVGLLAAAGCHQARPPVQGQASPYVVKVLAVERGEEPWTGDVSLVEGPVRDGEKTVAARWEASANSRLTSPAFIRSVEGVDAVRFWLWADRSGGCRISAWLADDEFELALPSIPLDFVGWRQITLAVPSSSSSSTPAGPVRLRLEVAPSAACVRPPGGVLYIDEIEAQLSAR